MDATVAAAITSELTGHVWTVGIDRPAKRNALNGALFHCGFVSQVVPDADVRTAAKKYCSLLVGKPPAALQGMRRLLVNGRTRTAAEAIQCELDHLNACVPAAPWGSIPHE